MGKESKLLYKARRDGWSRKVFLKKCVGQKETIVLVKTNLNSVIGGYCPDQWVDTTDKKNSLGYSSRKDIVSGKPFLFYFLDDQIEIIKHADDQIPYMGSDKDWLMLFGFGLGISAVKHIPSKACAEND
jgi:hypothetical protein